MRCRLCSTVSFFLFGIFFIAYLVRVAGSLLAISSCCTSTKVNVPPVKTSSPAPRNWFLMTAGHQFLLLSYGWNVMLLPTNPFVCSLIIRARFIRNHLLKSAIKCCCLLYLQQFFSLMAGGTLQQLAHSFKKKMKIKTISSPAVRLFGAQARVFKGNQVLK